MNLYILENTCMNLSWTKRTICLKTPLGVFCWKVFSSRGLVSCLVSVFDFLLISWLWILRGSVLFLSAACGSIWFASLENLEGSSFVSCLHQFHYCVGIYYWCIESNADKRVISLKDHVASILTYCTKELLIFLDKDLLIIDKYQDSEYSILTRC